MNKIYLGNWFIDIGLAMIFTLGVISGSKVGIIVAAILFTLMSMLRSRQEIKLIKNETSSKL